LSEGGEVYQANLDAIKQNLAQGGPVVVGMNVTQSFTGKMFGQKVWHPTQAEYMGQGNLGGHCMCLIGYDDKLEGGAFQIMNSWTPRWGENGVAWVRYKDFAKFDVEAYGLYPMPKRDAAANQKFAIQLGLIENTTKKFIPLAVSSQNLFKTVQPIAKGTKFKIAVNNPVECYTYVFGQETDNSSYVLFPYNKKHSPFCGITGQRVFPRTESLQADQTGSKDFMAVVVTKQALDYVKLNAAINASHQGSYQAKLMEALGEQAIKNVRFAASANGIIGFECDTQENQAVAMIIEVDKK
jgi:Papain family cysteine protease